MKQRPLRLGTRGSALALWQATHVRQKLERLGFIVEVVKIQTTGDSVIDRPLTLIGGKGLFLKELEDALRVGEIDLAVHSLKDVPARLPAGLVLDAFLPREDARDALVSRDRVPLWSLGSGARIGTTSQRRACQLLARRPDLHVEPLRGNVDTRLRKVGRGDVDAAVLALAGLRRLGLESEAAEVFSLQDSLPAAGQGIMVVEVRDSDAGLCAALSHGPTALAARAERAWLETIGGDCNIPAAAYAVLEGARLSMEGMVGAPDGSRILRRRMDGGAHEAEATGIRLAAKLLSEGGREILSTGDGV